MYSLNPIAAYYSTRACKVSKKYRNSIEKYQNLVTMYIGNLCDSGRFQSMGFLETPFIIFFRFSRTVFIPK